MVANLWAILISTGFGLTAMYSVLQLIQLTHVDTNEEAADAVRKKINLQTNFINDANL